MIAIDTLLFGLIAGLIGFKTALLALAALLLVYGLTKRARRRGPRGATARPRRRNQDVHA